MVKKYLEFLKESKSEKTVSYKNIVSEICISMVLLNNEFLDNILDRGIRNRYLENSKVFVTDLKNLLLAKNRLNLGKFNGDKCVVDDEISKANIAFDTIEFDMEKDWDKLINARITARNIMDKLLPNAKLNSTDINNIYWIGPNKDNEHKEDIVIETTDGNQYSFFLNKNLSTQKSASFNTFADDLIGDDINNLFKEYYLPKWDKLTQQWIKIIYENSNKNIQLLIEKFIDFKRIDTIGYFEYFDIRHKNPQFQHLGEFVKEFNKNILKLSDLMPEIWKNRETCFADPSKVYNEWMDVRVTILNSQILEHIFTTSLKTNHPEDIQKIDDEWKLANGTVKMKLLKTLIEKMDCSERPIYFLGKNGNIFNMVPPRTFFRDNYDDLKIKFDYHVKLIVSEDEENNDFNFKVRLELEDNILIDMIIVIKFTGSEMSARLGAKYKFDVADNFNYLISSKESINKTNGEFKPEGQEIEETEEHEDTNID